MTPPTYEDLVAIVSKKNFPENSAKGFKLKVGAEVFLGVVVRKQDRYYAYRNLCRHLPIPIDLNYEGNFFNYSKTHLQCHMHGALYEPETGLCTEGPCQGESLVPLKLEEEPDRLVIRIPRELVGND